MNDVIFIVIAIGIVIGGVAWIIDKNSDYGRKFEEGIMMMGPLASSMVGIICLSPVISWLLSVLIAPLFLRLGFDPAVLGGILPLDMGGYHIAVELAESALVGRFAGIIIGATFGCTLIFTVPVGMGMIEEKDHTIFSQGILIGLIIVPVSLMIGGYMAGLDLLTTVIQSSPIIILIVVIMILMRTRPNVILRFFSGLARFLRLIAVIGLVLASVEFILGRDVIPGMLVLEEGMDVVVSITIFLVGALPISVLLIRLLRRPMQKISELTSLNEYSIIGLLLSTISMVPTFAMIKDMDPVGKLMNAAFMVSAASTLAAHLAFTSAVEPSLVTALICSKMVGGIVALIVARYLAPRFVQAEELAVETE